MSPARPAISPAGLAGLLNEEFNRPVHSIQPIETGQIARVFSFTVDGEGFVIRFTTPTMAPTLYKERFIIEELLPAGVPVPKIVNIGQWRELTYMVMEKAPGEHLEQLPAGEMERLLPEQLAVLQKIHQTPLSDACTGYGGFDHQGHGAYLSWTAFLAAVRDEEPEGSFYGHWHYLFTDSFLEQNHFDEIYGRMIALFPYCPSIRYLVHGDYGYSNVLAQEGLITAVLDWANALFGDFLFDVAWLDLWMVGAAVKEKARPVYAAAGFPLNNFQERILCYQLYIILDSYRWYAKSNQPQAYQFARQRLQEILP